MGLEGLKEHLVRLWWESNSRVSSMLGKCSAIELFSLFACLIVYLFLIVYLQSYIVVQVGWELTT